LTLISGTAVALTAAALKGGRVNILGYALALLLFAAQPPGAGKVTSDYDKGVDFAKYKTYTWSHGPEDYRPKMHDLLVSAIDKEMATLGYTKTDDAKADLTLRYFTVRSTSIDMKELEKAEKEGIKAKSYDVGKLAVVLRETSSDKRVWAAQTQEYMKAETAEREATVNQAVAKVFQSFPKRKK
jgi:hypothetical protein